MHSIQVVEEDGQERRDCKRLEVFWSPHGAPSILWARKARMLCTCYYTYHACRTQGTLFRHLLQRSLEALKDLCHVSTSCLATPMIRTSSSILASAMSASLPLPLAIFCASPIWFLTAYLHVSRYFPNSVYSVIPRR